MMSAASSKQHQLIGLLLVATCMLIAQAKSEDELASNLAAQESDFSSGSKRSAFFVGSRYGRSDPSFYGGKFNGQKARRLIVVPRNEHFFLGSRFGKRTREYFTPYEQQATEAGGMAMATAAAAEDLKPTSIMACVYAGVANYYRCNNVANQAIVDDTSASATGSATGSLHLDDGK